MGCMYCGCGKKRVPFFAFVSESGPIDIKINGNKLEITQGEYKCETQVNYCPECGRFLTLKED